MLTENHLVTPMLQQAHQQVGYELYFAFVHKKLGIALISTHGNKCFRSHRFLYILRPPNGTQMLCNHS